MGLCPRTVGPKLHSIPSPLSRACWHTETRGSCFVSSKRNQWVEVGEGAEWNPQVIWQQAAPEEFCLWDSVVTGQLTLACVYKLARKSALNFWMLLRSMGALIKFWVLGLGLLLLLFFFFQLLCCLEEKHHVNFICLCSVTSPSFQTRQVSFPLPCWSAEINFWLRKDKNDGSLLFSRDVAALDSVNRVVSRTSSYVQRKEVRGEHHEDGQACSSGATNHHLLVFSGKYCWGGQLQCLRMLPDRGNLSIHS